jgi:hypothetical protein
METLVKFMTQDLNPERLKEEMAAAGVPAQGATLAGFTRINARLYQPFASTQVIATHTGQPDTTAEPGEIKLKFDTAPTAPQETTLDGLLVAHDATNLSSAQQNKDTDLAAIPALVNAWNNWDTFTPSQKDNANRQAQRLIARLLDGSQDI